MQDKEFDEQLLDLTAPWSVQGVDLQMKEIDEECPSQDHRQGLSGGCLRGSSEVRGSSNHVVLDW
jgi:hypothetical protein